MARKSDRDTKLQPKGNREVSNETKTTNTDGSLWQCNYKWLNESGFLRTGIIVIPANTAEEAKAEAKNRLASFKYVNIYKIKPFEMK